MSLENKLPEVILSACILHNYDLKENREDFLMAVQNDIENININIHEGNEDEDVSGRLKRDLIATLL